ncbi:hypothetical protein BS17DRAFT_774358 [Gyrodon lividus]|nr:hypothetical protein BS17DRAFT_774358 [Gyrodon lividus]
MTLIVSPFLLIPQSLSRLVLAWPQELVLIMWRMLVPIPSSLEAAIIKGAPLDVLPGTVEFLPRDQPQGLTHSSPVPIMSQAFPPSILEKVAALIRMTLLPARLANSKGNMFQKHCLIVF